ncbi:hypothetical protein EDB87DRAFT_1829598 [Lactarius vividus]|nr:hypothetical protein EDB87DRAFT_1829598 [Lactarius vividus]
MPTSTSSPTSNRGSRRQPHPDPSTFDLVQNSYQQASPTPFPQYDYPPHSTDQHDFSAPTFHRQRAISSYALDSGTLKFPEPQLYRASSGKATYRPLTPPNPDYRIDLQTSPRPPPPALPPRNFVASPEIGDTQPLTQHVVPETPLDISKPSLDSPAGLESFQAGNVPESQQEWARFVPPQALEALGKQEVERQSALFEVFKSELDYVNDLRIVQDVYITPLLSAPHEVMSEARGKTFVSEVFWNLNKISGHHQRMLGTLLTRQRDQHPLVQSVADIILDCKLCLSSMTPNSHDSPVLDAFWFTPEYESYIKHSPLSLELHRKELDQNPRYNDFIRKCSEDPRLRKRDFKTLLSRPITRLPRLKLVLERIQKLTAADHPDLETIPIVLAILQDFIKSSEPGITAAEGKVSYRVLYETLVFPPGEITDLDVDDESRTLVHSGPLVRQKSDARRSWSDVFGALSDNYFFLLNEETKPPMTIKRRFVWRPIPLEYLGLGSFDGALEVRKERADNGSFISISSTKQNVYPFTIHHTGAKAGRRYTLYAPTTTAREKWHNALVEAIGVRKARQDANKWYAPQPLNDGFFRVPSRIPYAQGTRFTGRVLCAAVLSSQGRNYLAVGCTNGIYVGMRTDSSFRRVLDFIKPTSIIALPESNNVIVHWETALFSYPLDLLIRVSQGGATIQELNDSTERLAQKDGNVLFCKAGRVANRTLVAYATKSFLNVTLSILEPIHPNENRIASSYRSFGSPVPVPRDTYDVSFLPQSVAICAPKSVHILKPMNMTVSSPMVAPDFSESTGASLRLLKEKCEDAKSLGVVRCETPEMLIVYDEFGCYLNKFGKPARSGSYIPWECKASAFAHRGHHLLLFSLGFIEVRTVASGRLVQVIEANDVRLLHSGLTETDMLVAGMTGNVDNASGLSEKLVELVQTTAIDVRAPIVRTEQLWDEWDM